MEAGQLVVITGPSGVGKGTLVRKLCSRHPEFYVSISATTRQPRRGEVEGRNYYFKSRQQFEEMIAEGELLEWAEYAGNYYGTPKQAVKEQINQGKLVLLEIEVVGAMKIKETFPDALLIFILPPSMDELENRLRKRGKDAEEVILRRLECAKDEIAASGEFDVEIVNDDLKAAIFKIETAIFG